MVRAPVHTTAHRLSAWLSCDTGMCRARAQQVTEVPFTPRQITPPPAPPCRAALQPLPPSFAILPVGIRALHTHASPTHTCFATLSTQITDNTGNCKNVTRRGVDEFAETTIRHGASRSLTLACPSPPACGGAAAAQVGPRCTGPAGGRWTGFPRGSASGEG